MYRWQKTDNRLRLVGVALSILVLAAECEVEEGRTDQAIARLQSLLHDYPGSPWYYPRGLQSRAVKGRCDSPTSP